MPPSGRAARRNQTTMGRAVTAVHDTYPTLEICLATIIPIALVVDGLTTFPVCASRRG